MIDLSALVLQEKREKGIDKLRNSFSDICTTRKIIMDYNSFVPPCLLSASTKSMYHPVVEELYKIFNREEVMGIACFVMAMKDFYLDYIDLISDFARRENVFMLESGYSGLKKRIDGLENREKAARFERDAWEEFILDISLPVYRSIFKNIREIKNERRGFIIPNSERSEINKIKNIINENNGKLPDLEKEFVANVLYKKTDGFSNNHLVVTAMERCYKNKPMKYHLGDFSPRVLFIDFENFLLKSYNICR